MDVKSRLNYWESLIELFEVANEVNKNITLVETDGPVFGVVLGELQPERQQNLLMIL